MKTIFTGIRISFLKIFILMSLFFISICIAILFSIYKIEQNHLCKQQAESVATLTENLSRDIINKLENYKGQLFITSGTTVAIIRTSNSPDLIRTLFSEVMTANTDFYQIRYIDSTGMEIYRMDRLQSGLFFVPETELQNKSQRYYFIDAVAQAPDTLYTSPLDLNIEHGKIEVPWVPTLRIATPITDPETGDLGIVIININVSEVLEKFRKEDETIKYYLLNSDGYYLAGAEHEKLWGFMFGNTISLKTEEPEIWSNIAQQHAGQFIINHTISTFQTVSLNSESHDNVLKVLIIDDHSVHFLPVTTGQRILLSILFLTIVIVSWNWSSSIVRKREAVHAYEETKASLIKSEKLASLGRLVAGIAHELNTPIGSTVTMVSSLQDAFESFAAKIKGGQILRSEMDDFVSSGKSATHIILNSLTSASNLIIHFKQVSVDQSTEQKREFLLPEYIYDIVDMLKPSFKHRAIVVEIKAAETLRLVSYPGPFSQVITNLVNNAVVHGFPNEKSGVITINVKRKNKSVVISVRDNGVGISEKNINHIFDPFFTTRPISGGTGLGLHISYNIVHDILAGSLEVHSEEGSFTEFIIRIPLDDG